MVDFTNKNTVKATAHEYDQGLKSYMQNIYNYMALALAFTGIIAYGASTSEAFISALYNVNSEGQPTGISGLGMLIMFSPLAVVLFLQFRLHKLSLQAAQGLFWLYAALNGLAFSSIFLVYTGVSIAKVFFITASVFGAMSIYGYVTKRDLTGMGSFLIMGVWGLLISSLVNFFFLKSSGFDFMISIVAVGIFVGLTAYDTQRLKEIYYSLGSASEEDRKKVSIIGALNLYINFIAIFINLLKIMGDRR